MNKMYYEDEDGNIYEYEECNLVEGAIVEDWAEVVESQDDQIEVWDVPINDAAYGPSPVLVAGATITICFLLASFLLTLTRKANLALAVADGAHNAISTQAALNEERPQNPVDAAVTIDPNNCKVSSLFPEDVRQWCMLITAYAEKHSLSPDLIAALIWLESGGDEVAYSHSGAVGLMQVMPRDGPAASFMCANGPCFSDRPTIKELKDPEFNIAFGTRYLARLLQRNGNLREALRYYGPMDAGYSYADKVLGIYQKYGN